MKKQSSGWLALLLAVMFSVGFASCDKDDDEEDDMSVSIIGKWEYSDMEGAGYVGEVYTFYENGRYDYEMIMNIMKEVTVLNTAIPKKKAVCIVCLAIH